MIFHYRAYGLKIISTVAFEELTISFFEGPEDLRVDFGTVPTKLEGPEVVRKVSTQAKPGAYLLDMCDVAKYYVNEGREVIIQPYADADMQSVRIFFLGSVMAAVLHQKRMLPFHASACCHNDKVVLFCGPPGTGKSTTSAHLHQRGYKMFSDDVCVVRQGEYIKKEISAYSSYPMSRLWKDTIDTLNSKKFTTEKAVRNKINKFANFFKESFEITPRVIEKIIVLNAGRVESIEIKIPSDIEKMSLLRNNVYRKGQMEGLGGKKELFTTLTKIIQEIPIIHIVRPKYNSNVVEFIDQVEDVICERATQKI